MWVIVDRLTKSAHFLALQMTFTLEEFCRLYIWEIVWFHGVPVSIVSDRDPRFTTHFLKSFQRVMGTQLMKTIQTLEDMLRACVHDLKGSLEDHLPLVELSYNNSYQANIQMTPYEALYGRPCRSLVYWTKVGERPSMGPDLVRDTLE